MISPQRALTPLVASLAFAQATAAPITFNTALPVGEGRFIVREQLVVSRSGNDALGLGRESDSQSLVSVLAYGVNAKLALFGVLPYTKKEAAMSGGVGRSSDGLGDVTLFGRYTLYQRDWRGRTLRVAGVAGIKAPTGDDDEFDDVGRLPVSLQLGTGSWDGFLGGVVSYQTSDFGIDAQLSYRANSEANEFEAGDEIHLDFSYQHRFLPGALTSETRAFLYGVLEVNAVHKDRSRQSGSSIGDSGGTTIFITPGIQYVTRKLIAEVGVQVPVMQNLNGTALENDVVIRAGFRIHF